MLSEKPRTPGWPRVSTTLVDGQSLLVTARLLRRSTWPYIRLMDAPDRAAGPRALEQAKTRTLRWLSGLAARWQARHAVAYGDTLTGRWWSGRAALSHQALASMAGEAS